MSFSALDNVGISIKIVENALKNIEIGSIKALCHLVYNIVKNSARKDPTMKLTVKSGIREIRKEYTEVEGANIEYTLFSIGGLLRRVYAIEIKRFDEKNTSFFGTDKKRAEDIFRMIVANTVTPCTLEDIAEDMAN